MQLSDLVQAFITTKDQTGTELFLEVNGSYVPLVSPTLVQQLKFLEAFKVNLKPKPKSKKPKVADLFDFKLVQSLFPKKSPGDNLGLKFLRESVKEQADYDQLLTAVKAYKMQRVGQDPQYTKSFKNWAREWRDHLPLKTQVQTVLDPKNYGG